jgi:hypothetical protein
MRGRETGAQVADHCALCSVQGSRFPGRYNLCDEKKEITRKGIITLRISTRCKLKYSHKVYPAILRTTFEKIRYYNGTLSAIPRKYHRQLQDPQLKKIQRSH